jgi:hypothetical protein
VVGEQEGACGRNGLEIDGRVRAGWAVGSGGSREELGEAPATPDRDLAPSGKALKETKVRRSQARFICRHGNEVLTPFLMAHPHRGGRAGKGSAHGHGEGGASGSGCGQQVARASDRAGRRSRMTGTRCCSPWRRGSGPVKMCREVVKNVIKHRAMSQTKYRQ